MQMIKPAKGYLTPREVADLLMVSPITVRQWAQRAGWKRRPLPVDTAASCIGMWKYLPGIGD